MGLAVFDFGFPGIHSPFIISPCGNDFQVRGKGFNAQFKTDLVVAFPCCAMADSGSPFFAGDFHQFFCDERPCHGGAEQIFVFIYGMGLYTGHDVLVTEFIGNIFYV